MSRARRGSILVLVMTILGLLFVTGVAFMATMNFEAQRMRYESQRSDANPAVGRLMLGMDSVMADAMTPAANVSFSGLMLGSTNTYAEMGGVHNLFSQIEPARDANWNYFWSWVTDIKALRPGSANQFVGSDATLVPRFDPVTPTPPGFIPQVNLSWQSGTVPPINNIAAGYVVRLAEVLDADGDGVSDSYATPLVDIPGLDDKQIDELKRALNPQSDPNGSLALGLRVIPHGGLVNLSYSHPALINNVLGGVTPTAANWPYNPGIEEPQLRRRNFLLPQQISPSGILGNPLIAQSDSTGGGDYSQYLFAIGDALDRHRYWPYGHDEFGQLPHNPPNDPDIRVHAIRLDPEYPSSTPLQYYDRRHLVTSISHDANIRRNVSFIPVDAAGNVIPPPAEGNEIIHWMHRRNSQACAGGLGALLPFEIANYPYNVRNEAKIITTPTSNAGVDYSNYCSCINDLDPTTFDRLCALNPAKGQLKLSLSFLDSVYDLDFPVTPATQQDFDLMVRLTYDAFTMMLLNMREPNPAWGNYVDSPVGSGLNWEWRWLPAGLAEVSRLAASLTANLIDYADADDTPTEVAIRSLDFSGALGSTPPGNVPTAPMTPDYVYGIERQPFITEVAASAVDQDPAMPTGTVNLGGSLFGVELFNPFPGQIDLSQYRIVTDKVTLGLSGTLGFTNYLGFIHDPANILPAGRTISPLPTLEFSQGTTVTLERNIAQPGNPAKWITVDSFSLAGTTVGQVDASPTLDSAQRSSGGNLSVRWTSPIPEIRTLSGDGIAETFGIFAGYFDNSLPGVFLENADIGSLTAAFPTTGMLLMLSRFANSETIAFTTFLDDEKNLMGQFPIDNGRMPVFDPFTKHRYPADDDPTNGGGAGSSVNRPGDAMHLPWGQFVFDYFTTLPLSSPGPYDDSSGTLVAVNPLSPPKVDMGGLRVHGRININAAPWKVLEGLPLVQLNLIPQPELQTTFQSALSPPVGMLIPLNTVVPIGPERAKAIVAYRELREFVDPVNPMITLTGNYEFTRGWTAAAPDITTRRGPGFMTIGELSNVRHYGTTAPFAPGAQAGYGLDAGELDPALGTGLGGTAPDYLSAIAFLACLQDWVTVRSDTFTVYGTLRGVADQTIIDDGGNIRVEDDLKIKDVDSRALRFQETISRIPMFGGSTAPSRIGDRVIARYIDARGD